MRLQRHVVDGKLRAAGVKTTSNAQSIMALFFVRVATAPLLCLGHSFCCLVRCMYCSNHDEYIVRMRFNFNITIHDTFLRLPKCENNNM